jgi:hypothetical protein
VARFLDEDVLPFAASMRVDVFRTRLANTAMRTLYRVHRRNLGAIFSAYAAWNQNDLATDAVGLMDLSEFQKMCSADELAVVGERVSHRAVRGVFAFVQEEEDAVDAEAGAAANPTSALTPSEWREAMVALSCYAFPNPYVTLDVKFKEFFEAKCRVAMKIDRFRGKGKVSLKGTAGARPRGASRG